MEAMTISQKIEKANNILNQHDFYHMMSNNRRTASEKARKNMRYFVEVTNTLPEELREAFRNLWIATHALCECDRPFSVDPEMPLREAEMNKAKETLNGLIAQIA